MVSDDIDNVCSFVQLFVFGPMGILIGAPLGALVFTAAFFIMTLMELPRAIVLGTKAVYCTGRLGPFAKIVTIALAFPLIAILALPISFMVGAVVGIGEGSFIGYELLSCVAPISPWQLVKNTMVHYVSSTLGCTKVYCNKLIKEKLPPDYKRFELNLFQAVIALLFATTGAIVCTVWYAICGCIFAIPNIFRLYSWLAQGMYKGGLCAFCFCGICATVTVILIPFMYVFVLLLDPIVGFCLGFIAPIYGVCASTLSNSEDSDAAEFEVTKQITMKDDLYRGPFSGMRKQVSKMWPEHLSESGISLIEQARSNETSQCECSCRCVGDFFGLTGIPRGTSAIWELCKNRCQFGQQIVYVSYGGFSKK